MMKMFYHTIHTVSRWVVKPAVLDLDYEAKGDIIVGTGHETNIRLPVGVDGQVIQADSGQTLGVKWANPPETPGSKFLVGAGAPTSGLGNLGDLYVDRITRKVYRKDVLGGGSTAYRSQNGLAVTGGPQSSHVVPMPAGVVAGDILVMAGHTTSGGVIPSSISGWTLHAATVVSSTGYFMATKIATGSEGASVTVTTVGAGYSTIGIIAYSGAAGIDVVGDYGSRQTTHSVIVPSVITTIANDMLVGIIVSSDAGSTAFFTPQAGWTYRLDKHNNASNTRIASMEKIATSLGVQPQASMETTEVGGFNSGWGWTVALKATPGATDWVLIGAIPASTEKVVQLKIFDDSTVVTTGDGKLIIVVSDDMDGLSLVDADAYVTTVSSSGLPTVQIRNVGLNVDLLSTKITIDATEYTSYTAANPAVINSANSGVAVGTLLAVDVDVAGTGAKGLGVILTFA
jgi:hypothetical protein